MLTAEKMKHGLSGTVLFIILLFLHSYAFQSSSLSIIPLNTVRLDDLSSRTHMDLITEDIQRLAVVRVPDTPPHQEVQKYILNELSNYPHWNVDTHRFIDDTPLGPKEFTNIIATWSPITHSNPKFTKPENEKRIVLAAHYDSKLFDFEFLAATDSAVPCALLLDVIRSLDKEFIRYTTDRSSRINSQLSLQIIFLDGEEAFLDWTDTDSLYGSRKLAQKWENADILFKESGNGNRQREGLENIELFILYDLLGASDPVPEFRPYFEESSIVFTQFRDLEHKLVRQGAYDLTRIPQERMMNPYMNSASARGYKVTDDHVPFMNRGVPVLHFIPYGFPKVWHKYEDNLSAVDYTQVHNWSVLNRVWVSEYFNFL